MYQEPAPSPLIREQGQSLFAKINRRGEDSIASGIWNWGSGKWQQKTPQKAAGEWL